MVTQQPLETSQQAANAAERVPLGSMSDRFEDLSKRAFPHGDWLCDDNRYRTQFVATLDYDIKNHSLNQQDLADYVVVSTILHSADGWSFLGRALDCLTHGDRAVACHLAYYAELRAVMAIMAFAGTCIGRSKHIALAPNGEAKKVFPGKGTHLAVWDAFESWMKSPGAVSLVSQVISPGGIRLEEWLGRFPGAADVAAVAPAWLEAWGLDIKRLRQDHDARNEASYRPTRLVRSGRAKTSTNSKWLREVWRVCQPLAPEGFELDRHLLHQLLRWVARPWCKNDGSYGKRISAMLGQLSIKKDQDSWLAFLTTKSALSGIAIGARGRVPISHPLHHLCVISRATILLRLATGACQSLLSSPSIGREDIAFWWRPLGLECGFWPEGNDPDSCADLWQDIEEEIGLLDPGQSSDPAADTSLWEWRRTNRSVIPLLGECERIALWGLGL